MVILCWAARECVQVYWVHMHMYDGHVMCAGHGRVDVSVGMCVSFQCLSLVPFHGRNIDEHDHT